MNFVKLRTRETNLNQGLYTYLPNDCIPNRMPYLAQQLMIDFIEGQNLPLRLVNTNHIAILYDKSLIQKIAVIYLSMDQQLVVEVIPGMESDPYLNEFLSNIEQRNTVGPEVGVHQ